MDQTIANPPPPTPLPVGENIIWTKTIPRINMVFFAISLVLVFTIDLGIAINSSDLRPFLYIMLVVLAIFTGFLYFENFTFRKRFSTTQSRADKWILLLIFLRNIVFLLNFIPFIQLLGLAILGGFLSLVPLFFGGAGAVLGWSGGLLGLGLIAPCLSIVYLILIIGRFAKSKQERQSVL